MEKKSMKWRVVSGYDQFGELLGYYVVRGLGKNPKQLEFDGHGAYLLKIAAEETCCGLNTDETLHTKFVQRTMGSTLKRVEV